MRIGVISDIHGNLPALQAVLQALAQQRVDRCVCAGDLVGYGPMPNQCVATIAERDIVSVAGNHDLIAAGLVSTDRWSSLARTSLEWTRSVLEPANRDYLAALPHTLRREAMLVAHGSVTDPEEYVIGERRATIELELMRRRCSDVRVLVLGHTHLPLAFAERRGVLLANRTGSVSLDGEEVVLVNPGSVGQSRRGRPRARFAVLDLERGTVVFHAVRYDVRAVRRALRQAGLSDRSHNPRRSLAWIALEALRRSPAAPVLRRTRTAVRGRR